jgi:pimeloyl-ACP methyl ester carboxylesterase
VESLRLPVADGMVLDAVADGPSDGPVVLLLHGFPQSSHAWRQVVPPLAAAGYRTVAPDLRGYSPDARPTDVAAYAMAPLVADAVAVVRQLSDGPVHVVGHDWGAAVAWHLAGRHPELVRSLTAVSVPHPHAFLEALLSDEDQRQRSQYMRDWKDPATEQRMLSGDLARVLGGLPGVDGEHYVRRLSEPGALTAALNYYRAQSRRDLDGLGPVTAPTLHVWSDGDEALGRYGAERTGAHVAGPYRFVELSGVSHWIPEQAPDRLVPPLLEHLASA